MALVATSGQRTGSAPSWMTFCAHACWAANPFFASARRSFMPIKSNCCLVSRGLVGPSRLATSTFSTKATSSYTSWSEDGGAATAQRGPARSESERKAAAQSKHKTYRAAGQPLCKHNIAQQFSDRTAKSLHGERTCCGSVLALGRCRVQLQFFDHLSQPRNCSQQPPATKLNASRQEINDQDPTNLPRCLLLRHLSSRTQAQTHTHSALEELSRVNERSKRVPTRTNLERLRHHRSPACRS